MQSRENSPDSRGQTGNTLVLGNLGLVDRNLGQLSGLLVPLDRLGTDRQLILLICTLKE